MNLLPAIILSILLWLGIYLIGGISGVLVFLAAVLFGLVAGLALSMRKPNGHN